MIAKGKVFRSHSNAARPGERAFHSESGVHEYGCDGHDDRTAVFQQLKDCCSRGQLENLQPLLTPSTQRAEPTCHVHPAICHGSWQYVVCWCHVATRRGGHKKGPTLAMRWGTGMEASGGTRRCLNIIIERTECVQICVHDCRGLHYSRSRRPVTKYISK